MELPCGDRGIHSDTVVRVYRLDAFPIAARAGETATLALGSSEGMSHGNTTVAFTDSQGVIHVLTANVHGIFKLYPDKASKAWDSAATGQLISSTKHEPWLTVMALDILSSSPVGPGTIRVTSTADYPDINAHFNDVPIRLEILPGAGMSNPLERAGPGNLNSWISGIAA